MAAVVPIEEGKESFLDVGDGIKLWYRTWGKRDGGTPVLFVHGGPGNCVGDYRNINSKFFEADRFFVVEVDQRGTGLSQPSVREDYRHMALYKDISIEQMSADFERVRETMAIDRWLVFGGSWGSTLGLDYATRYPARCLGLIVRGIFLNTVPEFEAVYCRKSFQGSERRQKEFDTFFEPAKKRAEAEKAPPLDPDGAADSGERFIRLYEQMVVEGDRDAIWRFHVFENNLMEEDPAELLDPLTVPPPGDAVFAQAQSVAFFECRLFLRGTFEEPVDLLARVPQLSAVPTWVVQGTGDEVCPDTFARGLVAKMEAAGVPHRAAFIDAGHKASSDAMGIALKEAVDEFAAGKGPAAKA